MKSKFNNDLQQLIPHNYNFANAMYGFIDLGIEIKLYANINDVYDAFTKEDVCIDYMDECICIFKKFGVEPYLETYPKELEKYLGRKIFKDTINSFSSNPDKFTKGYFIKPVKDKVFTGRTVTSVKDLVGCGSEYEDYEILVSESIDFVSEYRGFIYYDNLVDLRTYNIPDGNDNEAIYHHLDFDFIKEVIKKFTSIENRPSACCIDFGITKDGKTLMIEANDAYSLGCYGLASMMYAKFINARWSQLLNRKDELKFN